MNLGRISIEPRLEPKLSLQFAAILIAVTLSVIVCAILLNAAGADIGEAFYSIYKGAFGSWRAIIKTMIKATPLILCGIAVTVAFRAQIWNIGAEGQLFAGGIISYWAYTAFMGAPAWVLIPVVLLAAICGGALYGGLAGYLKARFEVNEVLSTVLLNYIIKYVLSFLLFRGPWRDPSSFYQQTPKIVEAARLPILLEGSRLHLGFLLALLAAVAAYFFISRTSLGYEVRAIGLNPKASRFKGINVNRTVVLVMLISGAIAGLAGASELFGLHLRLKPDISTGFGFTGIIIAMLAGLNPFGVVLVAVLFGGLLNGGITMQVLTGVPTALISAMEGIVLLFFLSAAVLTRFQLKLGKKQPDGPAEVCS
jgi:ABC-type uncharacterized transport system permease subunit